MNILLIGINARYNHINPAIRSLKRCDKTGTTDIMEAGLKDRPFDVLRRLLVSGANCFGFSTYIWNISQVRHLAGLLRRALPDCILFYGGPEAGAAPQEEFELSPDVDFVISGEAEEVYPKITSLLKQTQGRSRDERLDYLKQQGFKGVHFRGVDGRRANPVLEEHLPLLSPDDIDQLPARIVYVEGQRGCPFSCAYCMSAREGGLRKKEVSLLLDEIFTLSRAGAKLIKFVDRTFNADSAFAAQVLRGIEMEDKKNPLSTRFHFEISSDLLTPELIDRFSHAREGLFQIEAGVQSTDKEVLIRSSRRQNTDKVLSNLLPILKVGRTHVHIDLIAGLPGASMRTFEKSFNDCMKILPDMLQLGFLKVLRGTAFREEAKALGLVFDPHPPYEVIKTNGFLAEELSWLRVFEEVFDSYYNAGIFKTLNRQLFRANQDAFSFYKRLTASWIKAGFETVKPGPKEKDALLLNVLMDMSLLTDRTAQAFLIDLLAGDRTIPDPLYSLLPKEIFVDSKEGAELLNQESIRRQIKEHFPEMHLRSGKYLLRTIHLLRIKMEGEDHLKLYAVGRGHLFPLE